MDRGAKSTSRWRPWGACACALLGLLPSGCASLRDGWTPPTESVAYLCNDPGGIEEQYALARRLDRRDDPGCLDAYATAAAAAWPAHATSGGLTDDRTNDIYRSSVRGLIAAAQRLGHYDPRAGILLARGTTLPITRHGLPWHAWQFESVLPVGEYQSSRIAKYYAYPGVGVPMVVLTRTPARFLPAESPFAATLVLRPVATPTGSSLALEWYDPLRRATVAGRPRLALASDFTAPIGHAALRRGNSYVKNFLGTEVSDQRGGLIMLEPYQRGKIPLVLVHGLLSDPLTWANLVNDLRITPGVADRYQVWGFQYPTGQPFLQSAARLRHQLAEARLAFDPTRRDPAMARTVVVGHSMGGLIAKLQATGSRGELWDAVATQPLESVRTEPSTRALLRRLFYFNPSPDVARVVFCGTPHRGASQASRSIGRFSSMLVERPQEILQRSEQLRRDNPGLFRSEAANGVPTSVDLLQTENPLLAAMDRLPYKPGVRLHSILGDARGGLLSEPSDGVVTVQSARLNVPSTELVLPVNHGQTHSSPAAIEEILRILREHAGG